MMPDVPWPLVEVVRLRYVMERVVDRLRMRPEVLLQVLGEDHHLFWQSLMRIQALSSTLYKIGASVERMVVEKARGFEGDNKEVGDES
jgi:hypothetical protein